MVGSVFCCFEYTGTYLQKLQANDYFLTALIAHLQQMADEKTIAVASYAPTTMGSIVTYLRLGTLSHIIY